jgi:hypothetical protein
VGITVFLSWNRISRPEARRLAQEVKDEWGITITNKGLLSTPPERVSKGLGHPQRCAIWEDLIIVKVEGPAIAVNNYPSEHSGLLFS